MQDTLDAQTETKVGLEKERADLADKMADAEKFKNERNRQVHKSG